MLVILAALIQRMIFAGLAGRRVATKDACHSGDAYFVVDPPSAPTCHCGATACAWLGVPTALGW